MLPDRLAYRISEVALLVGVSAESIRRAILAGQLPGFKVGRTWYLPADWQSVAVTWLREATDALTVTPPPYTVIFRGGLYPG